MKFYLQTERLYLREMTTDDAENAYLLNLAYDVTKYTGDVAFTSIEEAKGFLGNYDHYKKYGFGRWGVIDKNTDEYLGWCGLKLIPELDEYDIGFRFFKKHWNKGYATEAAKACLEYGFTSLGINEIVGRAMKENKASIGVLQKLGLTFLEERIEDGEVEMIYNIEKSRFLKTA